MKLKSRGAAMSVSARALEFSDPAAGTTGVLKYFRGEMPEEKVLERCKNPNDETLPRAYLGLYLLYTGNEPAARSHLEWLRKNGVQRLSGCIVAMRISGATRPFLACPGGLMVVDRRSGWPGCQGFERKRVERIVHRTRRKRHGNRYE